MPSPPWGFPYPSFSASILNFYFTSSIALAALHLILSRPYNRVTHRIIVFSSN